jgi:hypothetical protein
MTPPTMGNDKTTFPTCFVMKDIQMMQIENKMK